MTLQPFAAEYDAFIRNRERLYEQLDSTRAEVDKWVRDHRGVAVSFGALAFFEGLISRRRALLSELVDLDDAFIDRMVSVRALGNSEDLVFTHDEPVALNGPMVVQGGATNA